MKNYKKIICNGFLVLILAMNATFLNVSAVAPMTDVGLSNSDISHSYSIKKQFESGLKFEELRCRDGFLLIQKYDKTPACVSPETKQRLIQRDWINSEILWTGATVKDFQNIISNSPRIEHIISKFGPPDSDIGSGIHIYVYELGDKTQIWIGYSDMVLYVRHIDSNGDIIGKLFERE